MTTNHGTDSPAVRPDRPASSDGDGHGGGCDAASGTESAQGVEPVAAQRISPPPIDEDFRWLGGPVGPLGLPDVEPPVPDLPRPPVADDFGDEASLVRPYAWTRGRTRANYDLKLETLVSTSDVGPDDPAITQVEHRTVSELCRCPLSVAEVAAKLSIPLGVARVILSDMAELGLISIHQTFADDDIAAHLVLMERVLSGLRRL